MKRRIATFLFVLFCVPVISHAATLAQYQAALTVTNNKKAAALADKQQAGEHYCEVLMDWQNQWSLSDSHLMNPFPYRAKMNEAKQLLDFSAWPNLTQADGWYTNGVDQITAAATIAADGTPAAYDAAIQNLAAANDCFFVVHLKCAGADSACNEAAFKLGQAIVLFTP